MQVDAVKNQLQRVLSGPQFSHAKQLRKFLTVIVEGSLLAGARPIKEYQIGVEVFGRGKDFDPRTDPIVRVQAAKLRSKLTEYYAGEGAADPIVISVPKGGYTPEIRSAINAGQVALAAQAVALRSRIAVLPFVNLGSDIQNDSFSDGLSEELINRLVGVPGLQVVARTSAFSFKGQHLDVREIGRLLDVGLILEGSVRQSGDQIRVTAQLIDAQSGYHVSSRSLQRGLTDQFSLQDDIAQAVVEQIASACLIELRVIGAATRPDAAAHSLYQRGVFAQSHLLHDLRRSEELLRQSVAIDPGFAPAWAALAHTYWLMAWYRFMSATEAFPASKQAATRCLAIDPASAQGLACLGIIECGFEWKWNDGEIRFRQAIDSQPGLAMTYPFYAVVCLLPQCRLDEACDMAARGLRLDPFNPLVQVICTFVHAMAGQFEVVTRVHALACEREPSAPATAAAVAFAMEMQGQFDIAIVGYRECCRGLPSSHHLQSFLAHALAVAGEGAEAQQILDGLLSAQQPSGLDIARVYAGLRDSDRALQWLEVAVRERTVHLLTVPADPRFAQLRGDARFDRIIRQMGLAKARPPSRSG